MVPNFSVFFGVAFRYLLFMSGLHLVVWYLYFCCRTFNPALRMSLDVDFHSNSVVHFFLNILYCFLLTFKIVILAMPSACVLALIGFLLFFQLQNNLLFSHRQLTNLQQQYLTTNAVLMAETQGSNHQQTFRAIN